ncbi:MAG TPA: malto-oligosyltrehalose trehalohydrolase [Candidatus Paceibacterota bacterium]|nr:malto-oligosyltrehalose trehalohydrolase [Verrucomicrobiota bacterium]HSA10763.1 malto-oligosyltrehalose trehalohydrolase [Candidatus Paceibacterota bacterium]
MKWTRVTLGATYLGGRRWRFLVWAPRVERVEVLLSKPKREVARLTRHDGGYHATVVEDATPGTRYLYRLDGRHAFPDPASRYQPDGVHGASALVAPAFPWTDEKWAGVRLKDYVLYELHVGTFTTEGTFEAAIPHLAELRDLGVTALELMPVAQFTGSRNWGYDGVFPYAAQNSYGGPAGLKRLVNAAHRAGLAVVLDVVYNHLGPEGNHLSEFGPYFMESHSTPWGQALDFAGRPGADVRRFFIENALYWQTEFHIDSLRLDAIHAIRDSSASPFLGELAQACHRQADTLKRPFHLIGEGGLDIVRRIPAGAPAGVGLDAEWRDDFHHCLHVLLTREQTGYYARFGGAAQFARVWRAARTTKSRFRGARKRGGSSSKVSQAVQSFVVYSQNHDQAGNRLRGERLATLIPFEARKLAAANVLLSPFIPLLFMGEEYGELAPFHYFISHSSAPVIQTVRAGRRAELAAFGWRGRPPDPQDRATFESSKLNHALRKKRTHRLLRAFYRELMRLRRTLPALTTTATYPIKVRALRSDRVLLVSYSSGGARFLLAFNYSDRLATVTASASPGRWLALLNSADGRWDGPGSLVPKELFSNGRIRLPLPAKSALALRSGAPG